MGAQARRHEVLGQERAFRRLIGGAKADGPAVYKCAGCLHTRTLFTNAKAALRLYEPVILDPQVLEMGTVLISDA
jgi:hypothetical protein